MNAIDQVASSAGFLRNSTQIIPDPNAVPSSKQSNIDTPVVWDKQTYRSFIQKYLNDCDYPPMVVCNVLERFEGSTQSGEPPELAVARIFHELSIPVDCTRLDFASVQGSLKESKGKEESPTASKKKQESPSSRQRQSHPESKPPPGMAADPEAFKAALAKHGFEAVSMRPATDADRAYMQSAMRQNSSASRGHHGVHNEEAASSDDDYSSDDDMDELPECKLSMQFASCLQTVCLETKPLHTCLSQAHFAWHFSACVTSSMCALVHVEMQVLQSNATHVCLAGCCFAMSCAISCCPVCCWLMP